MLNKEKLVQACKKDSLKFLASLPEDYRTAMITRVLRSTLEQALTSTIVITVSGGMVQSVENLPPGWDVDVINEDVDEDTIGG